MVGDTVPGVGQIESIVRWGNRWIVRHGHGLIAHTLAIQAKCYPILASSISNFDTFSSEAFCRIIGRWCDKMPQNEPNTTTPELARDEKPSTISCVQAR